MQAGQLQYSAVFNALGERILVDDQALNFLGQFGGVSYDLLPLPARPALPPPGASPSPSDSQPPKSTGTMPPSPGYPGRPPQLPETPSIPHSWGEPVRLPSGAYSPPANWRPVRTRWGEVVIQNAQQLTRDERRVLALINGQRTIPELSRLLGVSPEALANLLAYFQEQNLIS